MAPSTPVEAVTVDGFGTLVQLDDPVQHLDQALRSHGMTAPGDRIAHAFRLEADYYRPRSHEGRGAVSLARLRLDCVAVFLRELDADIGPHAFVDDFIDALRFELVPGAREALVLLRDAGISLACVANWDVSLHEELRRLGVSQIFGVVVTSADVGVAKPDPAIFAHALSTLGVDPSRGVHVGDESVDSEGAIAAGMRFEPIPLSTLPQRVLPAEPR